MRRQYVPIAAKLIDFNAGDENIHCITKQWLGKELNVDAALSNIKNHHLFEKMTLTFKIDAPIFILVELLETVEFDIFSLSRKIGLYFPDTWISDKERGKKEFHLSESKVHQEEALSYYTDGVAKGIQYFKWLVTGADVSVKQAYGVRPQCEMVSFFLETNLPTLVRELPKWKLDIPEFRILRNQILLAILKELELKAIGNFLTYCEKPIDTKTAKITYKLTTEEE